MKQLLRYDLTSCLASLPPISIGCNSFKNLTIVRLGPKITCALFGEYWANFVACENVNLSIKSNLVAKSIRGDIPHSVTRHNHYFEGKPKQLLAKTHCFIIAAVKWWKIMNASLKWGSGFTKIGFDTLKHWILSKKYYPTFHLLLIDWNGWTLSQIKKPNSN